MVDEDKLQVFPSKGKEIKGKVDETYLRGGLSHPLMHSEKTVHTVHVALVV